MLFNSIYQFQGQHPPQCIDCRLWRVLFRTAIRDEVLVDEEDSWRQLLREKRNLIAKKGTTIDDYDEGLDLIQTPLFMRKSGGDLNLMIC